MKPAAWLVTGGRAFVDRAFIQQDGAEKSVSERKDGAKVVPLYAVNAPELLAALSLVRMSAGWQYLSDESRAVIITAIAKATGEQS